MAQVVIRLDFPDRRRVGPGKVALLEAIGRTGSIAAAGRSLGMSYRRAWLLVEQLNAMFDEPVVVTHLGGAGGGGAALTGFGAKLARTYRAIEAEAQAAARAELERLETALAAPPPAAEEREASPSPPSRPTP